MCKELFLRLWYHLGNILVGFGNAHLFSRFEFNASVHYRSHKLTSQGQRDMDRIAGQVTMVMWCSIVIAFVKLSLVWL